MSLGNAAGRLPLPGDRLLLERLHAGCERRHVRKALCRHQSVGPLPFQDIDAGGLDSRDQARDAIARSNRQIMIVYRLEAMLAL
jgi:hypothetical protein